MDELFQLVIFVIILALGLLSGRRRKKRPTTRQPTAARRRTPAASTATRARPRPAGAPETAKRSRLEETLLELLGQQLPQPVPPPQVERPSVEVVEEPEAQSLEELEISTEARHAEFHERYMEPLEPPRARRAPALELPTTDAKSLREAVIWTAILGRPKGLDP